MTDISTKKEAMPSAAIPPVLAIFAEKNGLSDLLNQVQAVFASAREKNVNLFYFLRRTLGSLSYVIGGSQKKEYKSVMPKPELGKAWEKKTQDWKDREGDSLQEAKKNEERTSGGDVETVSSVLKTILDFSGRVLSNQQDGAWVTESDAASLLKTIREVIEQNFGKMDTKVQPGYRYKPGSGMGVPGQEWEKYRSFEEPSKIGRTSSVQSFIAEILEAAIQRSAPLFPVIPPVDFTMRELLNIKAKATDEKSASVKGSVKESRELDQETMEHFARFSVYEIAKDVGFFGEGKGITKQNKKDRDAVSKQLGVEAACSNLLFDVGLIEDTELLEKARSVAEKIIYRVIEIGRIMNTCAKFNTAMKIASVAGELSKKGGPDKYEFLGQFGFFDRKAQRKISARLAEDVQRLFALDDLAGGAFELLKLIESRDLRSTQVSRQKQLNRAKKIEDEKAKAKAEGREWKPPQKAEPKSVAAAKKLEKSGADLGLEDFDPEEKIPGAYSGGDIKDLSPDEQERLKQGKLREAKGKEEKGEEAKNKKGEEREQLQQRLSFVFPLFKSWLSGRAIASRLLFEFGSQTIPGVPEGEESVGLLEDFYMDSLLYPVTGNQKMSELASDGRGRYKDAIAEQIARDWFRRLSAIYVSSLGAGHASTVDKLGRRETVPTFKETEKTPETESALVDAITYKNIEEIISALEMEAFKRTMIAQAPGMFVDLAKTTGEQVLKGLTEIRARFEVVMKIGEKLKMDKSGKYVSSFMNSVSALVKALNKDETGGSLNSVLRASRGLRALGQVSEKTLLELTKKSFTTPKDDSDDVSEIFGNIRHRKQISTIVKNIQEELNYLNVSTNAKKISLAIQQLSLVSGKIHEELVGAGLLAGGSSPTGEVSAEQVMAILGVVENYAGLVAKSIGSKTISSPPETIISLINTTNARLQKFNITEEGGEDGETGRGMFTRRIYDAASSAIYNQLGEVGTPRSGESKTTNSLTSALRVKINGENNDGWAEQVLARGMATTPTKRRGLFAVQARKLIREFEAMAQKQRGTNQPAISQAMSPKKNFLEFVENDILEFWGSGEEDEEAGPGAIATKKKRGPYKKGLSKIDKMFQKRDKEQTSTAREERAKYNKSARVLARQGIVDAMTRLVTSPNSRKELVDMISKEIVSTLNYAEESGGSIAKYDYDSKIHFAGKTMTLWDFAEAVIKKVHQEVSGQVTSAA